MTELTIRVPAEAVDAAAEYLPHAGDCEVRPERDCTCWQLRVNLMREALTAAAPFIAAQAWDGGNEAGYEERATEDTSDYTPAANPYRSGT